MFNPPVCLLIAWESRNWRKLKKAATLCKDCGLAALSKKLFIGNVKKDEMPELQQKLSALFVGPTDRLFLFMICKSCLEVSSIPGAIHTSIAQPPTYEIVG
jgi:hypothetical protein